MSGVSDGGPAFPQKEPLSSDCPGMSLRAYFAAHAPSVPSPGNFPPKQKRAIVASGLGQFTETWRDEPELERVVRWNLAYADAMLEALK